MLGVVVDFRSFTGPEDLKLCIVAPRRPYQYEWPPVRTCDTARSGGDFLRKVEISPPAPILARTTRTHNAFDAPQKKKKRGTTFLLLLDTQGQKPYDWNSTRFKSKPA